MAIAHSATTASTTSTGTVSECVAWPTEVRPALTGPLLQAPTGIVRSRHDGHGGQRLAWQLVHARHGAASAAAAAALGDEVLLLLALLPLLPLARAVRRAAPCAGNEKPVPAWLAVPRAPSTAGAPLGRPRSIQDTDFFTFACEYGLLGVASAGARCGAVCDKGPIAHRHLGFRPGAGGGRTAGAEPRSPLSDTLPHALASPSSCTSSSGTSTAKDAGPPFSCGWMA